MKKILTLFVAAVFSITAVTAAENVSIEKQLIGFIEEQNDPQNFVENDGNYGRIGNDFFKTQDSMAVDLPSGFKEF